MNINDFLSLPFWQVKILGNTVEQIAIAVAVFLVLGFGLKITQSFILTKLRKAAAATKTDVDDFLVQIIATIKPSFYFFLALYFGLRQLALSGLIQKLIDLGLIVWAIIQAILITQVLIDYLIAKISRKELNDNSKAILDLLNRILRGTLWGIGLIMLLSNVGVNVGSLLAGLGIGGVAVALAAQNILGDLFSSFVIYFDKPFMVGDFIVFGDKMGTVERIGIKTTRLRSISGEEIVVSNQQLTSTQIKNFKRMGKRRVVLHLGVVYNTPDEKLKKIPEIIKSIIASVKDVEFDRAHFYQFGASSLDFEVVYFVSSGDYSVYMDRNQEIHFAINKKFKEEGIEMAYPTQSVYLVNSQN